MKNNVVESEQNRNGLMNTAEVAEYLGLKLSRIRYEVFIGNIPYLKIGRSVRFSKLKIDQWLDSKMREGSNAKL